MKERTLKQLFIPVLTAILLSITSVAQAVGHEDFKGFSVLDGFDIYGEGLAKLTDTELSEVEGGIFIAGPFCEGGACRDKYFTVISATLNNAMTATRDSYIVDSLTTAGHKWMIERKWAQAAVLDDDGFLQMGEVGAILRSSGISGYDVKIILYSYRQVLGSCFSSSNECR